ncbi:MULTISPECIES: hypothetical protein [unclassified Bradyrhizobium]|uniref:hypothetical protein n=1 Tax=unclassified Bradyrhizobium TaxID=2631580 RepID=UPI001BA4A974|nr:MULTISPECIES: hypothetical protein [unclassified Bradyrhizobium]MBR1208892.1 hypothetical protein [Bradyrhizobium sp. AUGA SZCCT0124]MBR1317060.1 hypothetical protein [Bradyrhizobium sp. AUGA SZCCT0051]MBR1345206.1 hypothetical protein [Bradyrhizobium sp. AUGA SZCCT0105]MBR1360303.1 hypothetical protein [Bradyrhizobium sp. AUGA SZCCT0045]
MAKLPDLTALINTVLQERAEAISFSNQEIDAAAERLRAGLTRIQEKAAARNRVVAALENLPNLRRAGWLSNVQSALQVVLGEARRTSQVLTEAASGLLPAAPDAWNFAPTIAGATRSLAGDAMRADSTDPVSGITASVIVDDAGPERRVLARLENYPADRAPVVMLVIAADDQRAVASVREIDPEVGTDRADEAGRLRRQLRYEAVLPAGSYFIFFGNPREPQP